MCDGWCQVWQKKFGADGSKSEKKFQSYVMCEVAIDQDGDMKMILCVHLQLDKIN